MWCYIFWYGYDSLLILSLYVTAEENPKRRVFHSVSTGTSEKSKASQII